LFIAVDDNLAITIRAKAMASIDQLGSQVAEVVDFAVVNGMNCAVFVGDGTAACIAEVEDAQPSVDEANSLLDEDSMVVGTAAGHGQGHSGESRLIRPPAVRVPNSPDSAHFFFSSQKARVV
jgi:hypothetical protein